MKPFPESANSAGADNGLFIWTLLLNAEAWRQKEVLSAWKRLVADGNDPNVMYQSLEWFEYLQDQGGLQRLAVALARGAAGQILGIVPLRIARFSLPFHVAGTTLGNIWLTKLWVLGGRFLMPESTALYQGLFAKLHSDFPKCTVIGLDAVAEGSFLWRYLHESKHLRQLYVPYAFEGLRRYHTIPLPGTFQEYLAKFNAKKRYNLKRQARVLQDQAQGALRLQCAESPDQLNSLLDVAIKLWPRHIPQWFSPVANRSDAYRRFTSLATHGLLRSYYLQCGSDPVACILGFQHGAVYVVDATMYNKSLAHFSPGAVMQFLALQDLISRRPVRLINFGFGDPKSGYESTNVYFGSAAFLLFRNTLANRVRRATHSAFQSTLATAKKIAKRLKHKRGGGAER
jgi:hypothetical protein